MENDIGGQITNRFDRFDAVESPSDLELLASTLMSVQGASGRPGCVTPYVVTRNPDFIRFREGGDKRFFVEDFSETLGKMENQDPQNYSGLRQSWLQLVSEGLFKPQFHGPEHFNPGLLDVALNNGHAGLLRSLQNESLIGLGDLPGVGALGWTCSFDPSLPSEFLSDAIERVEKGISAYSAFFKKKPVWFAPSALGFPQSLETKLPELGIQWIDAPFVQRTQSGGVLGRRLNWPGKRLAPGLRAVVRNCMFEPGEDGERSVGRVLSEIAAAFRWNKPAIISSHRVNFCGSIDPENRENGIGHLRVLLKAIVKNWPDVEFVGVEELPALLGDKAVARA